MSIHRFTTGQRFLWNKQAYEVKRVLPAEQRVNLENMDTGAFLGADWNELVQALFSGHLYFESDVRGQASRQPQATLELPDYPAQWVEVARWRWRVIEPLLKIPAAQLTKAQVKERVDAVKAARPTGAAGLTTAASCASIYRWLEVYRRSGQDLRALLPQLATRGGPGRGRLPSEANALIQGLLKEQCFQPEAVGIDEVTHLIAARLEEENQLRPAPEKLTMPSRSTIARRIADLDLAERFRARQGRRAAKREFAQAEQMTYPELPYERVEIDHTRCDVLVIDERDNLPLGRPTLTHCLDLATRYPLGYYLGFEPPSYFTVMECLYGAIGPKGNVREKFGAEHDWLAYGVPTTLVVDNGKEFIGQDLTDACNLLGIVLQQCPIMTPELKAGIERQFRTLNSGVFHTLPGTTFSNIFERGAYASAQVACLSLAELEKALVLFLVDIYAERPHRGLGGIPARRWEQALAGQFMPRLPPNRDELAILLGRVAWRVLHAYGIEFEGLRYNASDLGILRARLKGAKVKLKYHPGDLSRIYLFDPFEKRYHPVPALDQEYTQGLSVWKHRIIRRVAQLESEQVDLAALGRARRKIQETVDAARTRQKKTRTRTQLARWEANPPQATQPPPRALPPPGPQTQLEPTSEIYDFDYSLASSHHDSAPTQFGA